MDGSVDAGYVRLKRTFAILATVTACIWCLLFGVTWIRGGSMEPALSPGDVVVYRRGAVAAKGDIVLFSKSGWPGGIVHRVVDIDEHGSLRTCGDANETVDADEVTSRDVRGVVVVVVPFGKLWSMLLSGACDVLHSSTNRIM